MVNSISYKILQLQNFLHLSLPSSLFSQNNLFIVMFSDTLNLWLMFFFLDFSVITVYGNHYRSLMYWVLTTELLSNCGHTRQQTFFNNVSWLGKHVRTNIYSRCWSRTTPDFHKTFIHLFSSLSYDRSKASSKVSSPHSAIQSFLFQMRVSSPFIKVIQ